MSAESAKTHFNAVNTQNETAKEGKSTDITQQPILDLQREVGCQVVMHLQSSYSRGWVVIKCTDVVI